MAHIPSFGNALVTISVSASRMKSFNFVRRAFHYDNWKDLTSDEAMGGWTLELDEGQYFVWIRDPSFAPRFSFSFENIAVHELTHVLCRLLEYIHSPLSEANEPAAYLMGWLMDASVAVAKRDVKWLKKEGFVIKEVRNKS